MQDLHVRVDDELADQLQELAEQEETTVSAIVRKAVRGHVRRERPDVRTAVPAHEGSGRVR